MNDPGGELSGVPSTPTERRPAAYSPVAVAVAGIAIGVIVLDQVTKAAMAHWLGPMATHHRWEIIQPWIAFEYVENTGAAFGLLAGRTWLLSIAAFAIAGWFVVAYGRLLPSSRTMQIAVGLVLGGAFGNLLDRLRLGYVVDFIAIGLWPRFNLADSAISLGLILLLVRAWRGETIEGDVHE